MKKHFKLLTLLLCIALLVSILAGCGSSKPAEESAPPAEESAAPAPEEAAPAEDTAPEEAPEEVPEEPVGPQKVDVVLPLVEEPMDISMYLLIPPFITTMLDSINDLSVVGELEKRTGLTFDITPGNYIDGSSVLNILIASGDYPDIINHIDMYSNGSQAAIEDDVVIDLYDYVVNDMPNMYSSLLEYDCMKQLTTADGMIAYFPQLSYNASVDNFCVGLRTDLMDELGYEEPKTYDQLHDILAGLYDNYGLAYGLQKEAADQALMVGYNLTADFRVIDGKVEHSYVSDDMYEYLSMLRDWYADGFILTDFINYEHFTMNEMLASGTLAGTGNVNAQTINEADTRGEGLVVGPLNFVTRNEGEQIHVMGQRKLIRCAAWSITTDCAEEKIPVICQMVDYLFTDEGALLLNYGVEGEGYTLDENGEPQWGEVVINSDSGFNTASFIYATGTPSEYICGLFDESKFQYNYNDRMHKAMDIINNSSTGEYDMPLGATGMISVDDNIIASSINGDLSTYMSETTLAWVMGEAVLDDAAWQEYVDHCYSMDLQQLIDIYQKAYDDFMVK